MGYKRIDNNFFFRSVLLKNRKLLEIGFLSFFVIFHKPPIIRTVGQLFYSTVEVVEDWHVFNHNVNVPHSGEQVLPTSVREMLYLLKKHKVESYQVSEQIRTAGRGFIYQRLVESSWPRKISKDSKTRIMFISEMDGIQKPKILERGHEVALVLYN